MHAAAARHGRDPLSTALWLAEPECHAEMQADHSRLERHVTLCKKKKEKRSPFTTRLKNKSVTDLPFTLEHRELLL